jgi:hypothetical protein
MARRYGRAPRGERCRLLVPQGQYKTTTVAAALRRDEVSCYCTLEHEVKSSVAVKIETWARDRSGSSPEKATEGVFTYVVLNGG